MNDYHSRLPPPLYTPPPPPPRNGTLTLIGFGLLCIGLVLVYIVFDWTATLLWWALR